MWYILVCSNKCESYSADLKGIVLPIHGIWKNLKSMIKKLNTPIVNKKCIAHLKLCVMCSYHNKINFLQKIKKPNVKDYTLHDSMYRQHTEKTNLQIQRADGGGLGLGEEKG